MVGYDLPRVAYIDQLPNGRPLRLQWEPNCRAYARFIFDSDSMERIAFAAALMGRTDATHYFFRSAGEVQSSGDIVAFMGRKDMYKTLGLPEIVEAVDAVVADTESFEMRLGSRDSQADLAALLRHHAVSVVRHRPELGLKNALKFALLETCRRWGIHLKCLSLQSENVAVKVVSQLKSSDIPEECQIARQVKDLLTKNPIDSGHEILFLASIFDEARRNRADLSRLAMELFTGVKTEEGEDQTVFDPSQKDGWLQTAVKNQFPS